LAVGSYRRPFLDILPRMQRSRATIVSQVTAGIVAGVVSHASVAFAVDNGCFDAYEQTQRLRNSGKLVQARAQAAICSQSDCPATLKRDCIQWNAEIGHLLGTVVFAAKDEKGQDATVTGIYVDDRKVADAIDGRPVTLEPGPHKVRFERGDRKVETIIQVPAGASNQRVEQAFAPAAPPPQTPGRRAGIPRTSLILGGVAGIGLVSFVSFAIAGRVEQGCSPLCSSGQISTMRAEYAVADVSWITGLAAVGGAVAFWYLSPAQAGPQTASTGSVGFGAIPVRGGATLGLRGTF